MYAVRYTADALKTLRRIPRNMADVIRRKVQEVAEDPAAARNVKALKGRRGCRLRVGDWRVVYDLDNCVLVLIVIEVARGVESMTSPAQIIRDGDGNPAFAVLPIDEYGRLLEAADEALANRAFDAYTATQPETFPDELAERLLNGEHPVKVFREHRGLTQKQLADAAGLTQGYVSQIEAGARVGTVDALKSIADALRVDLDDLT